MHKSITHKCPVCHMLLEQSELTHDYMGMHFIFCTQQCKDRFITNPRLYIGSPGNPSLKQQGRQVVKRRVLKLEQTIPEDIKQNISDALNQMMGVRQFTIQGDRIEITYDLLEATIRQIEVTLVDAGNRLSTEWGAMLKRAFIHFLEETEIDSLENSGGGHCHH